MHGAQSKRQREASGAKMNVVEICKSQFLAHVIGQYLHARLTMAITPGAGTPP
jgi:hypothetical protein